MAEAVINAGDALEVHLGLEMREHIRPRVGPK
jgi:hypothetical protein